MDYVDNYIISFTNSEVVAASLDDVIVGLTVNVSKDRTRVNTMNRRRLSRGFKSGTKVVSGTLTLEVPQAGMPVDFYRMVEDDEAGLLAGVRRSGKVGNKRFQIVEMVIMSVEESGAEDGSTQIEIEYEAIDFRNTN